MRTLIENRLWFHDENGAPLFSGKYDRLAIRGNVGLLWDYKTARGEVVRADGNMQLRALAVLVKERFPELKAIYVAIIQPWASPSVSVCLYEETQLYHAKIEILDAVYRAVNSNNLPRIPGERQCKYCRGLSVCPEAKAVVKRVADRMVGVLNCDFSPIQRSQFLEVCQLAKKVIAAEEEKAKDLLMIAPDSIPGWRLKPGAVKSTITDVPKIYERIKVIGLDAPESFAAIVSVTKKDLKGLLKYLTRMKGKALDDEYDALVEGCTEEKQNAPSLERIKP